MRQFEDLTVGETACSKPMTVARDAMLAFARTYDPQWFHADAKRARESVFGEVIASGIYTAALWRQLDHTINGDVDFICGVAWEEARWPTALKAGDTIRAASEILDLRPSGGDATRGVAVYLYRLLNQHDQEVFSCRSVNLVRRAAQD